MPGLHHQAVDPPQNLRRQQGDVVHDQLPPVAEAVERIVAVAEHLAHRPVLVGQLLQAVEVAAQALLENGEDHDPPDVHPRTAHAPVDLRAEVRIEKREQPLPRALVAPDQLQAPEDRRDVVAGQRIDLDALDRDRTQPGIGVNDLSHDANSSEDSSETARNAAISPKSCHNRRIFARRNRGFTAFYQRVGGFVSKH